MCIEFVSMYVVCTAYLGKPHTSLVPAYGNPLFNTAKKEKFKINKSVSKIKSIM